MVVINCLAVTIISQIILRHIYVDLFYKYNKYNKYK